MPDNIEVLPSGDGAAVSVATDDIGGIHYPIYKPAFGVDGEVTLVSKADPLPVDCSQLAMGPIYNNGTHKFFGEAQPGTALATAAWRVSRMDISTKQVDWADGDSLFDNVFTSVGVVELLVYS